MPDLRRPPSGFTLRLYRLPIALYRLGLGGLLGSRFLLLEHRGRRSGRTRYAVLEVVRRDPETSACIVASGFGEGSQWFRNLAAEPRCRVQVGRRRFVATARQLTRREAEHELAEYVRRHPRAARAVVRAIGLDLDVSTPAGIERFARDVPLVAFEPSCSRDPGERPQRLLSPQRLEVLELMAKDPANRAYPFGVVELRTMAPGLSSALRAALLPRSGHRCELLLRWAARPVAAVA